MSEIFKFKRFEKPVIVGDYVNIYKPKADVYNGIDTENFKNGTRYDVWTTNDFTPIYADGVWHIIGITHPKPPLFISPFVYGQGVHEAEYQLFHCTAKADSFKDIFYEDSFKDEPKILYPQQRPGEFPEVWAPHVEKIGDEYYLIYSPKVMRYAKSKDLYNWEQGEILFECDTKMGRDPFLFTDDDGTKYMLFCEDNYVKYRKTTDMVNWSEEMILQTNPYKNGASESPYMMKRNGVYYLMWCLHDNTNGCYDNRTFVFAAENLADFEGASPVTMLEAHAPEFLTDGDDTYILSVFYPNNGISAAKIEWV